MEIEDWIGRACDRLGLTGRKANAAAAREVCESAQSRFVRGAPRVWWLGLPNIVASQSSEDSRLSNFVQSPEAAGWFIPELEGQGCLAYRLSAREVEALISECPYFEYYFLDPDGRLLIAETDHNQFVMAAPADASTRAI